MAMKKLTALSFFVLAIGLSGCAGDYPPVSGLPNTGWRCMATDSDGNPWYYNAQEKALAAQRALESCRDSSPYSASCAVGPGNCEHF
jgi:hypothetical protein